MIIKYFFLFFHCFFLVRNFFLRQLIKWAIPSSYDRLSLKRNLPQKSTAVPRRMEQNLTNDEIENNFDDEQTKF